MISCYYSRYRARTSWALLADEVKVTGTAIKQGNGMEVSEVIFSLKEVSASLSAFVLIADSMVGR